MSKGSLGIFFSNMLVATLVTAGMVLLLLPVLLALSGIRKRLAPIEE